MKGSVKDRVSGFGPHTGCPCSHSCCWSTPHRKVDGAGWGGGGGGGRGGDSESTGGTLRHAGLPSTRSSGDLRVCYRCSHSVCSAFLPCRFNWMGTCHRRSRREVFLLMLGTHMPQAQPSGQQPVRVYLPLPALQAVVALLDALAADGLEKGLPPAFRNMVRKHV